MKAILPLLTIPSLHLPPVIAQSKASIEGGKIGTGSTKFVSLTGIEVRSAIANEEVKFTKLNWFSDTLTNRYYDEYVRLKKAIKLKTNLEVINRFSEEGWELVTILQQSNVNLIFHTYYFKKRYSQAD